MTYESSNENVLRIANNKVEAVGVGRATIYAKSKDIGTVITVGELAKELAKGADGKAFDTIEDAKSEILKTIKSGDVVLVKASHSMQFENIVEFLKQNF